MTIFIFRGSKELYPDLPGLFQPHPPRCRFDSAARPRA
jgi:hypothetical protein